MIVTFRWSFADDGGALGGIAIGPDLPAGTVIWDGIIQVLDPLTSDGAAAVGIRLGFGSDEILAEDTLSNNSLDAEGLVDIVPDGTATNSTTMATAGAVGMVISDAALTGGVLVVHLRCFRAGLSEEESSSSSSSSSSATSSSASSSSSATSSSSETSSSSATSSATSSSSETSSSSSA